MQLLLPFLLAVLLFVAQVCHADTPRIGISLPLSGDAAAYGADFQKIYTFANEKLANNSYQLVFEDDQCDPRMAVSVANKFTSVEKLKFVLGLTCDGVFSSAAPIYNKAGTLVISTSGSIVPGKRLFHTVPLVSMWPQTLLKYLKGRHAVVAILSEETGFAQDFTTAFVKSAPEYGIQVTNDSFRSSDIDFRSILLRLTRTKPEAVLFLTQTDASLLRLVKQFHELKLEFPIFNVFFAATKTFLGKAGKDAEGIMVVDMPNLEESLTEGGKTIYREFVDRYGPLGSGQAMFASVFEAFRAMHLAIDSGKDPAEYLRTEKFLGLHGPWFFDQSGFWVGQDLVIKRIKNGEVVSVTTG